jgi:hypothetical protein
VASEDESTATLEPISSAEAELLVRDLSKLRAEARSKGCDPRSKRIYELLDSQTKRII